MATNAVIRGEVLVEQDYKKVWGLAFGADKAMEVPLQATGTQLAIRDGDVYLTRQEGQASTSRNRLSAVGLGIE